MSNTLKDQMNAMLFELNSIDDIEASAVVSRDGLLISAQMSNGLDADTFAAMTATMMGAAETAIVELDKGIISQVTVESDQVTVICVGAGERALLVLTMSASTSIDSVRDNVMDTKDKIIALLNQF